MIKQLLMFLGIRKAQKHGFLRRNGAYLAPVGGVLPALGWLAYHNRARLMSMYKSTIAPKLSRGRMMGTGAQTSQSAAI